MAHSPGVLRRNTSRPEYAAPLLETEDRPVCQVLYHGGSEDREVHGNAHRILAAWNGTMGIPTESLEAGYLRDVLNEAWYLVDRFNLKTHDEIAENVDDLRRALRRLYGEVG